MAIAYCFEGALSALYAPFYVLHLLLSGKKFFDRYAVLLERAKSKGLISFCEVSS